MSVSGWVRGPEGESGPPRGREGRSLGTAERRRWRYGPFGRARGGPPRPAGGPRRSGGGPKLATGLAALLLWLAAGGGVGAQSPGVFALLEGPWEGEGTLLGRPAHYTMRWEAHAGFAVLTFQNAFAGEGGARTPVLSSVAIYRTSDATPEAVWLDSRGVRIEIAWERTDSALVANWTAPTETGRTTYRLEGTDALAVTDEVRAEDSWRVFGSARLTRPPSPTDEASQRR